MADTDFYKKEIERLQDKAKDWHRVTLEATGVLSKLGGIVPSNMSPQDVVRRLFDKTESLIIAHAERVAECMFLEKALQELIQHTNAELSDDDRWVDISEGCFENASEFSIEPSEVSTLVKYLRQNRCCGDVRCHNKDSSVDCAQDSPIPGMTKLLDDEGVYDRKVLE